jgi:hypothetical protein
MKDKQLHVSMYDLEDENLVVWPLNRIAAPDFVLASSDDSEPFILKTFNYIFIKRDDQLIGDYVTILNYQRDLLL